MADDMAKANIIEEAKKRCRRVIGHIEALPASINDSCKLTLLRLARAELSFLSRPSSSPLSPLSVNIGHLEAVVHILQQPFVAGVSRVCKPVPRCPSNDKDRRRGSNSNSKAIHVDMVCTIKGRPVWIIVSSRNPDYVFWDGCRKDKGLRLRIHQVLEAARSSLTLRPSSIVIFFSNGVNENILQKIMHEFSASEFGMEISDFAFSEEVDDEWVNIFTSSYRESMALEIGVGQLDNATSTPGSTIGGMNLVTEIAEVSEKDVNLRSPDAFSTLISGMKSLGVVTDFESAEMTSMHDDRGNLINFDTTALIALVSEISNGGAEKLLAKSENELRQRFKGNVDFVIGQAKSELQKPIHAELGAAISGKRGIICETALLEFKELIFMCGGPKEKRRAEQLLKCLIAVPDHPSDRIVGLPTSRKLAQKNKVVFGTGDYWNAPTLTANLAFLRAISQTGLPLYTINHRPRALTGD